jgi:hypothetical protein
MARTNQWLTGRSARDSRQATGGRPPRFPFPHDARVNARVRRFPGPEIDCHLAQRLIVWAIPCNPFVGESETGPQGPTSAAQ